MTVFIPVQLISTQQGKLAALFALTNEALQGFQSPVELNLQTIKAAPAGGVAHRREVLSRKTPETHAARPAAEKFWSAISSSARVNSPGVVRAQHEAQSRQAQRFGEIFANNPPGGAEAATAEEKSLSTASLTFETTCETPAKAIKSAESHLSADPPTGSRALEQGAIPMPRIAWQ
jgi:Phasin protein